MDDGSAWKIHPEDTKAYRRWLAGDLVQPVARTSFYWFKREHKFRLYNYNSNEGLRAMIVSYPTNPVYIVSFQDIVIGGHWENKQVLINNEWATMREWVNDYKRNLYLSDGHTWTIPYDVSYTTGRYVLPGRNSEGDRFWYFLGLGLQRDGRYVKAEAVW